MYNHHRVVGQGELTEPGDVGWPERVRPTDASRVRRRQTAGVGTARPRSVGPRPRENGPDTVAVASVTRRVSRVYGVVCLG